MFLVFTIVKGKSVVKDFWKSSLTALEGSSQLPRLENVEN